MTYRAPVKDMLFAMRELADLEGLSRLPGLEDASLETATAVLEECARFTEGVVAPLNVGGDRHGAELCGDAVKTAPGRWSWRVDQPA